MVDLFAMGIGNPGGNIMALMWVLAFLLVALAAVDISEAYEEYTKDRHSSKLMLHGVLLIVMGLLVMVFAAALFLG